MNPETQQPDNIWIALVSVAVWTAYLDHFIHSLVLWHRVRGYREFRGMFIATMLQVGLTRIASASLLLAFPDIAFLVALQSVVAPLLTVMLLTGAFVLAFTWRMDPTYRRARASKEGKL